MEVEIGLMLAIFCPLLSSLILYKVRKRGENYKRQIRKIQNNVKIYRKVFVFKLLLQFKNFGLDY